MLARSKFLLTFLCCSLSATAMAGKRNLFDYKDGQIQPQLAKTVSKVDETNYRIVLDISKEIKQGTPVSIEAVKSSVESRLGKSLKAKVKAVENSKDTLTISFKGKEETFLKRLAKTRIKPANRMALAASSQKTDAGIRAKAVDEKLAASEVRLRILKIKDEGTILGQVVAAGSGFEKSLKAGKRLKITAAEGLSFKALKKGSIRVFQLEKQAKSWLCTAVK